jgi:hypothetical protein
MPSCVPSILYNSNKGVENEKYLCACPAVNVAEFPGDIKYYYIYQNIQIGRINEKV